MLSSTLALLLVAIGVGVGVGVERAHAQGQEVLGVLKIKQCVRDVSEYMPAGVQPNTSLVSCTGPQQSLQLVNILATPSTRSQSLVQFNTGDQNITDAERLAVGSQALLSGRALVRLEMSAVRVRFILDEVGLLPHAYKLTAKECGTDTCNVNRDRNDGGDIVLFCPQNRTGVNGAGQLDNGVRALIGRRDRLMNNDLWPPNVGCRQALNHRWWLAYLGPAANSTLIPLSTNAASAQIDDTSLDHNTARANKVGNWILRTPLVPIGSPTPSSESNRIQCYPNRLPYFIDGDAWSYFQSIDTPPTSTGPVYRNVFFADGRVPRDTVTQTNQCFGVVWQTCARQSDDARRLGVPCRDFRYANERQTLAFGSCFGAQCHNAYEPMKYAPSRAAATDYVSQWTTLVDAQRAVPGEGVQTGYTLAPMCDAGKLSNGDEFRWPNNYANTAAYSPLVNVNRAPDNDDPDANPAEGRNFDAYGAPGQCGKARCAVCLAREGPMNDMNCDNDMAMHWQFPIYYRRRIRERPQLEFNATATVTTDQNVTLVFPVGRVSIAGASNEQFVLSSFFAEDGSGGNATNLFQVSILSVSPLGVPPTQRGEIIGIRDKWRPGGVISLDEAVDFAVRWINQLRGGDAVAALPFAQLSAAFDPRGTTGAPGTLRRPFPDAAWNRYPCCQEPGEYSVSRLALLRSIYPEMDDDAALVGIYQSATVFRTLAKRGARQYGRDGDGFNDGSVLENPWGVGKCGSVPCPPPDGWFYADPPEDSVIVGPDCGDMGMTNEWLLQGENVGKYCRSGQIGVCVPGFDIVQSDPPSFPDVMRARRTAEYQRQLASEHGAYSQPMPFLPPFLQYNDGRQRVWTCNGSLCFESPEDYGLSVWFQFAFSGDFIQLITDLPSGRFVTLTAPADACNMTVEQDGVLFAAVENTGRVGGEFSVFIQCDSAPYDILTPSPQTQFILPGATGRYQFVIRATGAVVASLQQCLLVLQGPTGRPLSQQSVDCLTQVPQGFISPNGTVPVPTATPPFDHGGAPSTALVIALSIVGTLLLIIAFEYLRRWVRGMRRWVARRRLQRANNRAKLERVREVSREAQQRAASERSAAERVVDEAADRKRSMELVAEQTRALQEQTKLMAKQEQVLERMAEALSKTRAPL